MGVVLDRILVCGFQYWESICLSNASFNLDIAVLSWWFLHIDYIRCLLREEVGSNPNSRDPRAVYAALGFLRQ